MEDDSLQELSRLQAVAAALQERPDAAVEDDYTEDFVDTYDEEEALLAKMGDDTEYEDEDIEVSEDELLEDIEDGFDDEAEQVITATTSPVIDTNNNVEDVDTLELEEDGFEEGSLDTEIVDTQLIDDDTLEIEEDGFEDDGFEDDTFEEDMDDGFEEDDYEEPVVKSMPSTPLAFPGSTLLKPPVSTPIVPVQSSVTLSQPSNDEDELLDMMDDGFEDDVQDAELETVEESLDIEEEISEEIEVDEQYIDEIINRGANFDNSFEKAEPEGENPDKIENLGSADDDPYVIAEIEEFLDETDDEAALDLSVLETVPLMDTTPVTPSTTALEAENERLRRQLAELENEKLKKMLAEQSAANTTQPIQSQPTIKLNISGVISQPERHKAQSQPIKTETDKERQQRQRWAKYSAMSTQDLWKLVYRFMTMAGVQKAPVKARLLIDEFGSRNIKRLEATYIMATKDGYTC